MLLGGVQQRQSSAVVVGRCAERGQKQLASLQVQIMVALVAPSAPHEGHPSTDLLVLLHFVDRKVLCADSVQERRHSGVLAPFARAVGSQDFVGLVRKNRLDDSAALELGGMAVEQRRDGCRHRR
jgi:hypothetical protein